MGINKKMDMNDYGKTYTLYHKDRANIVFGVTSGGNVSYGHVTNDAKFHEVVSKSDARTIWPSYILLYNYEYVDDLTHGAQA